MWFQYGDDGGHAPINWQDTESSNNVEEEAHCYVVRCGRIVCGQYVADYSTTNKERFGPKAFISCVQNNLQIIMII